MAISADDLDTQQRFSDSLGDGLPFPLVADPQREVIGAYGTLSKPGGNSKRMTFFVEQDGTLSYVNKNVDPRDKTHYDKLLEIAGAKPLG